MNERSYSNFDIVIERNGDGYRARVIGSPAGQASVEFDSLFTPLELENFVLRMGRPQRGMRRIDSPELMSIRNFGTRLFRTVFSDQVYACYLRSLDNVVSQNKGLRIRLRIDAPELHDLPWEYLYNPHFDQFLALSKDTPVIRYIELPYNIQALPLKASINILVMISSPADYPSLDVEEEWNRLNKSLGPLIDNGRVVLKKLKEPTLNALQQHLRREQVHIFHFIGHGKYLEHQQEGMLMLEDDNHRGRPASGQQLGALLHDHHTLRLVVLNACEGARTSAEDPYTGVAQTLVRQGIPAVLAMQFEIFENASITLAHEFYGAIADGYPVDAALSEARKAIFAGNNDVEWGTPVLFMRVPNGVLFKQHKSLEKSGPQAAADETAGKTRPLPQLPETEENSAVTIMEEMMSSAPDQVELEELHPISEAEPEEQEVDQTTPVRPESSTSGPPISSSLPEQINPEQPASSPGPSKTSSLPERIDTEGQASLPGPLRPSSLPERINPERPAPLPGPSKPSSLPEQINLERPASLPEGIVSKQKPKGLPR